MRFANLPATSRLVTFEFENVPAATAAAAADVRLCGRAGTILHTTQHRLREKTFLNEAGLPLTPFRRVISLAESGRRRARVGLPAILKTADFGYDGKGQFRIIYCRSDLTAAWQAVGESEAVLEAFVDFEREISVVAARSAHGDFIHYGAIENQHSNGILDSRYRPRAGRAAQLRKKRLILRETCSKSSMWSAFCASSSSCSKTAAADQ